MLKDLLYCGASLVRLDRALRHFHRGQLKVLLYHNVEQGTFRFGNSIAANDFAGHLAHLRRHYNPVEMAQNGDILGMRADRVNVLITFDDGFINNVEVVVPLLREHGMRAVFFVIVDCLAKGQPPAFQLARLRSGEDAHGWRTVTVSDIRAMRQAGMAIGSHSLAHTDSRTLEPARLVAQARESRDRLEDLLGEPASTFAFPWGFHNSGQPEALLSVFDKVFLTQHGFAAASDRVVPRNEVANLAHLPHAASGTVDLLRREQVATDSG